MLLQSAALLEMESKKFLADRLFSLLSQRPLSKPDDHSGPAETDMFLLDLTGDECEQILRVISQAAVQGRVTAGTQNRGLGGFIEAWTEYAEYLRAQ